MVLPFIAFSVIVIRMIGERIEIALAVGDGNRRVGFKPPLSDEQLRALPKPPNYHGELSQSIEDDGSGTVQFTALDMPGRTQDMLDPNRSKLLRYGQSVQAVLGESAVLDSEVRYIRAGSPFSEAAL